MKPSKKSKDSFCIKTSKHWVLPPRPKPGRKPSANHDAKKKKNISGNSGTPTKSKAKIGTLASKTSGSQLNAHPKTSTNSLTKKLPNNGPKIKPNTISSSADTTVTVAPLISKPAITPAITSVTSSTSATSIASTLANSVMTSNTHPIYPNSSSTSSSLSSTASSVLAKPVPTSNAASSTTNTNTSVNIPLAPAISVPSTERNRSIKQIAPANSHISPTTTLVIAPAPMSQKQQHSSISKISDKDMAVKSEANNKCTLVNPIIEQIQKVSLNNHNTNDEQPNSHKSKEKSIAPSITTISNNLNITEKTVPIAPNVINKVSKCVSKKFPVTATTVTTTTNVTVRLENISTPVSVKTETIDNIANSVNKNIKREVDDTMEYVVETKELEKVKNQVDNNNVGANNYVDDPQLLTKNENPLSVITKSLLMESSRPQELSTKQSSIRLKDSKDDNIKKEINKNSELELQLQKADMENSLLKVELSKLVSNLKFLRHEVSSKIESLSSPNSKPNSNGSNSVTYQKSPASSPSPPLVSSPAMASAPSTIQNDTNTPQSIIMGNSNSKLLLQNNIYHNYHGNNINNNNSNNNNSNTNTTNNNNDFLYFEVPSNLEPLLRRASTVTNNAGMSSIAAAINLHNTINNNNTGSDVDTMSVLSRKRTHEILEFEDHNSISRIHSRIAHSGHNEPHIFYENDDGESIKQLKLSGDLDSHHGHHNHHGHHHNSGHHNGHHNVHHHGHGGHHSHGIHHHHHHNEIPDDLQSLSMSRNGSLMGFPPSAVNMSSTNSIRGSISGLQNDDIILNSLNNNIGGLSSLFSNVGDRLNINSTKSDSNDVMEGMKFLDSYYSLDKGVINTPDNVEEDEAFKLLVESELVASNSNLVGSNLKDSSDKKSSFNTSSDSVSVDKNNKASKARHTTNKKAGSEKDTSNVVIADEDDLDGILNFDDILMKDIGSINDNCLVMSLESVVESDLFSANTDVYLNNNSKANNKLADDIPFSLLNGISKNIGNNDAILIDAPDIVDIDAFLELNAPYNLNVKDSNKSDPTKLKSKQLTKNRNVKKQAQKQPQKQLVEDMDFTFFKDIEKQKKREKEQEKAHLLMAMSL